MSAPVTWLVLREGAAPGSCNMARDHALALGLSDLSAEEGGPVAVLRFYGWNRPTISFGRNEPARDRYGAVGGGVSRAGESDGSAPSVGSAPVAFVRRPTGGRSVRHSDELTYAVVVHERAFGGPRGAYRRIHEAIRTGLTLLGVEVRLARGGRAVRPDAGPCFGVPAAGELVAPAGKIAGSAQVRIGAALLQHGSILISDDQFGLGQGVRAATLGAQVAGVDRDRVREAVEEGFYRSFPGAGWRAWCGNEALDEAAERLERERYGDEAWTWRR